MTEDAQTLNARAVIAGWFGPSCPVVGGRAIVVVLKKEGLARVLNGKEGMTFVVNRFTVGLRGPVAHVRDYRYPGDHFPWQVWSLGADEYEVVT